MDSMYVFLQHYWWFLVSLLGALLVFLLFVQGGQTFLHTLGRDGAERAMLVNALGKRWGLTFTTLVTFGGAFFASFPLFYSTSFGGAFWVWVAILICFVLQAVAYEYRAMPKNVLGQKTFDIFLYINGFLGTFLLGTAVGTFFTGSDFTVNRMALTEFNQPIISAWGNGWHGLEALLDYRNVLLGLAVCFLARVLGLLYYINAINDEAIATRARYYLRLNAVPFLAFFLAFVVSIMLSQGFAVDGESGQVSLVKYKYLSNLVEMPIVLVLFVVGVLSVLWGIAIALFSKCTSCFWASNRRGIWFSGFGTVCTVLSLFLLAGYHGTAYYPSTTDLQSSLTIYNSSSSKFTLSVMGIVSLLIPIVAAYIWYAWRRLDRNKLTKEEFEGTQGEGY